jgi:hypothetical protein
MYEFKFKPLSLSAVISFSLYLLIVSSWTPSFPVFVHAI